MKLTIITAIILLLSYNNLRAQVLIGRWEGYFEQNYAPRDERRYEFIVEIKEGADKKLVATTYSTRKSSFCGKAEADVLYDNNNKSVVINEKSMLDSQIAHGNETCTMKCDLTYSSRNKIDYLSGEYTSTTSKTNRDCGTGTVYLIKWREAIKSEKSIKKVRGSRKGRL